MSGLRRIGLMDRFAALVSERLGLSFPRAKRADLEARLAAAAEEFGTASSETLAALAVSSSFGSEDWSHLAQHLTVNETHFWRDHAFFDALIGRILPSIGTSGRLRVWCAGCSTGEEPYSVAIAVARAFPHAEDLDVGILATDIGGRNLDKARKGIYGPWSFRGVPDWLKDGYFTPAADGLAIRADIRAMVTFEQSNLVSETAHRDSMDLILCRNVLMYFTDETAALAAERLGNCLTDAGWLAVAASEVAHPALQHFAPVTLPGTVLLRKTPPPPAERNQSRPARVRRAPVFPSGAESSVRPNAAPGLGTPLGQGRSEAALASCEEALAADRLNADLHYLRAVILLEMSRNERASEAFQNVLYLDPHHILAHYMLGSLKFRQGETETARTCFAAARRLLEFWGDDAVLPGAGGWTVGDLRPLLGREVPR